MSQKSIDPKHTGQVLTTRTDGVPGGVGTSTKPLQSYRVTVRRGTRFIQWVRFAPTLQAARASAAEAADYEGYTLLYVEPCTDPRSALAQAEGGTA